MPCLWACSGENRETGSTEWCWHQRAVPSHLAESTGSENRHFRIHRKPNGISEKGENGCKVPCSQR